jgi:hypothetical protein
MKNSATINFTLSEERFGAVYVSKQVLDLIQPEINPFMEFRGSEDSPVWHIIPHKVKPATNLVFKSTNTLKGKKLIYKMNDFIDVEADINKFAVEIAVIDGVMALKFDVSANTNTQIVNTTIVGGLYNPFELTNKKVKPVTFSEYAPVPLSRGYYAEN